MWMKVLFKELQIQKFNVKVRFVESRNNDSVLQRRRWRAQEVSSHRRCEKPLRLPLQRSGQTNRHRDSNHHARIGDFEWRSEMGRPSFDGG